MSDEEDTAEVADARATLDLVYVFALNVARKALQHVERHDDVHHVAIEDRMEGAGYTWHVVGAYGRGHQFVTIKAEPKHDQLIGQTVTPEAFMQVQANGQAGFNANVPKQWIELAGEAADARSTTSLLSSDDPLGAT